AGAGPLVVLEGVETRSDVHGVVDQGVFDAGDRIVDDGAVPVAGVVVVVLLHQGAVGGDGGDLAGVVVAVDDPVVVGVDAGAGGALLKGVPVDQGSLPVGALFDESTLQVIAELPAPVGGGVV